MLLNTLYDVTFRVCGRSAGAEGEKIPEPEPQSDQDGGRARARGVAACRRPRTHAAVHALRGAAAALQRARLALRGQPSGPRHRAAPGRRSVALRGRRPRGVVGPAQRRDTPPRRTSAAEAPSGECAASGAASAGLRRELGV